MCSLLAVADATTSPSSRIASTRPMWSALAWRIFVAPSALNTTTTRQGSGAELNHPRLGEVAILDNRCRSR